MKRGDLIIAERHGGWNRNECRHRRLLIGILSELPIIGLAVIVASRVVAITSSWRVLRSSRWGPSAVMGPVITPVRGLTSASSLIEPGDSTAGLSAP